MHTKNHSDKQCKIWKVLRREGYQNLRQQIWDDIFFGHLRLKYMDSRLRWWNIFYGSETEITSSETEMTKYHWHPRLKNTDDWGDWPGQLDRSGIKAFYVIWDWDACILNWNDIFFMSSEIEIPMFETQTSHISGVFSDWYAHIEDSNTISIMSPQIELPLFKTQTT